MFLLNATIDKFEEHYLNDKEAPALKIEPDVLRIIQVLEILQPVGYTRITSALLDLYPEHRKQVLQFIYEKVEKTKKDFKIHFFSSYFGDPVNCGITFIATYGKEDLKAKLCEICTLTKYKCKANRWVGITKDVTDDQCFVNSFLYVQDSWKQDSEMDELVSKYFKDDMIKYL